MDYLFNVFLIVIDSLRSDHLGCYGYKRETSPEIDRIAEEGIKFEKVISQSSWTKPSVASLLTSTIPEVHRVKKIEDFFPSQETLLPTILKKFGYITGCIQTNPFLSSKSGFSQGFDYFIELFERAPGGYKPRTSKAIRAVFDWLDHVGVNPFFLYLHLLDTHNPYAPPQGFNKFGSKAQDRFDGEVHFVDYHIGLVREYLIIKDLQKKTLLIITADHGEEFEEHGHRYHAKHLYEEVLRVPLIISSPAIIPSGLSMPVQVRSIDIVPTILELLGIPPLARHQGESLLPLPNLAHSPERPAISQIGGSDRVKNGAELISLNSGGYKLIWNKESDSKELYHLLIDPQEIHNIAQEEEEKCQELQSQLENFLQVAEEKPFHYKPKPEKISFDEDLLIRLRDLGYL